MKRIPIIIKEFSVIKLKGGYDTFFFTGPGKLTILKTETKFNN